MAAAAGAVNRTLTMYSLISKRSKIPPQKKLETNEERELTCAKKNELMKLSIVLTMNDKLDVEIPLFIWGEATVNFHFSPHVLMLATWHWWWWLPTFNQSAVFLPAIAAVARGCNRSRDRG